MNARNSLTLAITVALWSATGCSSLAINQAASATANADAKAAAPPEKQTPSFTIQFKNEGGKLMASKQLPLEGDVFVQDALDKTGAFKRFRRTSIELFRITPQGAPHKMAIAHDRIKHRIEPQCNYAVHAGDTIVLTEDTTTVFDDMMGQLGPFSKKGQTRRN